MSAGGKGSMKRGKRTMIKNKKKTIELINFIVDVKLSRNKKSYNL